MPWDAVRTWSTFIKCQNKNDWLLFLKILYFLHMMGDPQDNSNLQPLNKHKNVKLMSGLYTGVLGFKFT
jgi:hypothetical protein